ncbi:YdeI/OmpD-associated family protein [Sphingobacterium sp. ML3W]|uniref:YdeI/OmpD-associated family protein n=1 Tax=Sphingobacterium sp. ML3W TaxID=1538644 RepID=UPI00249A9F56|nr:YdeI/OmpD-associated family protein [Sphingobacterium sp. ML3W]WFA80530.1 YdeI/OmpD-associated family protein [Sphingobacterium sp. ML3W]
MNLKAQHFFENSKKWNEEFNLLREIVVENQSLVEDYKWMHPCYTFEGKNVVLIHGFKDYCALLFHKGALLKDKKQLLIQQTENVQSGRQLRFTHIEQIANLRETIVNYIQEAVAIEKSGAKVNMRKTEDYPVPEEFAKALNEDKEFQNAFLSLTPGRQKGYLFYFNQAKQAKTREARIEKYYQHILEGKGIDD